MVSHHLAMSGFRWRNNIFNMPRDLKGTHNGKIKWCNGSELLIVCHHPAKFFGHRHRGSRHVLIHHVILQDHMI